MLLVRIVGVINEAERDHPCRVAASNFSARLCMCARGLLARNPFKKPALHLRNPKSFRQQRSLRPIDVTGLPGGIKRIAYSVIRFGLGVDRVGADEVFWPNGTLGDFLG